MKRGEAYEKAAKDTVTVYFENGISATHISSMSDAFVEGYIEGRIAADEDVRSWRDLSDSQERSLKRYREDRSLLMAIVEAVQKFNEPKWFFDDQWRAQPEAQKIYKALSDWINREEGP
jgi:hypothetical protein